MRGRAGTALVVLLGSVLLLAVGLLLSAGCALRPAAPATQKTATPTARATTTHSLLPTNTPLPPAATGPYAQQEATVAAALTAQAVAQATATAQAEAARLAIPTPIPWTASVGVWTPESAAELPHWSGSPIQAGEAITASNASSAEALGQWGHGRATALVWSPDGRWLAVGTPVGVYLHDAKTLAVAHSLKAPAPVSGLAFSPDGAILAVTGGYTVQLWETATWQPAQVLLGGGERVAFSLDGHLLAAGSPDSTVQVWQVDTWQSLQVLAGAGYEVAFSPDSSLLASSDDEAVRLWEVGDWYQVRVLDAGSRGMGAYRLSFSPDGTLLAAAGTSLIGGKCEPELCTGGRIWAVTTGEKLAGFRRWGIMSQGPVSVAFSPDGSRIALGYWAGGMQLMNADAPYGDFLPQEHAGPVLQLAFSPDGAVLASVGADGTVQLREVAAPETAYLLPGYLGQVQQVALSPLGNLIAIGTGEEHSGHGSGTVLLGEAETGRAVQVWRQGTLSVQSVGFSPDGAILAVGSTSALEIVASLHVQLWTVGDGSELWGLGGEGIAMAGLGFLANGARVAAITSEYCRGRDCQWMRVWETLGGRDAGSVNLPEPAVSLALSPKSTLAAITSCTAFSDWPACAAGRISFWDLATGQLAGAFLWSRSWSVASGMAFSPDGTLLATGATNGTVYVWEGHVGQEVAVLQGATGAVRTVAFSPDGTLLVAGSADGTVRLWEVTTGRRMLTLHGHVGAVNSVAFSPDGTYFVSGGWDGTVRVWGIP